MKTSNWIHIALAAVIIFLLVIVFRRCDGTPTTDRREVDSLTRVLNEARVNHTRWMQAKNLQIDSIRTEQFKTQIEAITARKEVNRLIAKGREITQPVGPVKPSEGNYDSLAIVFNALAETTEGYLVLIDTLTVQYDQQIEAKDSIIARQTQLLFDLQHARVDITGKYIALEKDYLKSEKKRKRNAGLNKVLAGALIVVTGIVIAK